MAAQTLADAPYHAASAEHIDLHDLRARHVPDVPEDVDFLLEHLNDPNFDLTSRLREKRIKKDTYEPSHIDTESQFDSDRYSSRAGSQITAVDDFDE